MNYLEILCKKLSESLTHQVSKLPKEIACCFFKSLRLGAIFLIWCIFSSQSLQKESSLHSVQNLVSLGIAIPQSKPCFQLMVV